MTISQQPCAKTISTILQRSTLGLRGEMILTLKLPLTGQLQNSYKLDEWSSQKEKFKRPIKVLNFNFIKIKEINI